MKKIMDIIKSILHRVWEFIKESPKSFGALLVGFNGLFQLAISQQHILALVTIRPTLEGTTGIKSEGIGMFFFLFILFGLVSIFAGTRIVDKNSLFRAVGSNLITIGFGVYYLLQITNPSTYITFGQVQNSVIIMILGLALYILAIILYLLHLRIYKKDTPVIYEN
ncbi:hypothetical protein [Acholeplasma granularum]|uniref:hypothetical protein n=1 Tax=Acholeplasma granularum TaxID=264635 RepID=UPI00046F2ED1|nr:hypothetical protein [Acholeplasma granularum]